MNIHHIYYAAEVARYGSINKAASCLFISQSALSRSIKELEEELGFQLFIRTPNGVLPTHQGQEFLRRAQRLNDQYIALREQYYTNQQLPVVQLSFAAIRCVIVELLLIQLYRRYQDRQYLNLCVCEERVGKVIDYVYDGLYSVGLILVEESLATVDGVRIDLYTGRMELYKAGAAPTVAVREGRAVEIDSTSLPAGILSGVSFERSDLTLGLGDMVILLSDGATTQGSGWIAKMAVEEKPRDLNDFCRKIAATARLRRDDGREDDITVLCCRLVNNGA